MGADVFYSRKMLTTNLKGGLGNQMFQYAAGLNLAEKTNSEYFLDISGYSDERVTNSDTPREFELRQFEITAKISNPDQIDKVKYPYGLISKIFRGIDKKILKNYYKDYHPKLLKKVSKKLSAGKDVYLDGYFQSEKNFGEIRPILLQEFKLKPEFITPKVRDFVDQISGKNSVEPTDSVSIHIRRGDYAQNPKTKEYHGLCPLSYYEQAIKTITEKIEKPHFYIFTDDPEWVKENLKINYNNTFVSGNDLKGPQELWLMSKCDHNIIANSSFSWWGAWLNQNKTKYVIAPKKWTTKGKDHPNIMAKDWITI